MGKLLGIATRDKSKGPMVVYAAAKVTFKQGIGDDSRGKIQNHRQVTVMTVEGWNAACADLNRNIHWTTRRANLLVEGINLEKTTGKTLKIGKFYLEITGELNPCNRMDDQIVGLTKALEPDWRGGVTCKILSEGIVKEGDQVSFVERV